MDIATKANAADFATAVDRANEDLIAGEIRRHFPTHDVIGEETVGTGAVPVLTANKTWIIDPIGEHAQQHLLFVATCTVAVVWR